MTKSQLKITNGRMFQAIESANQVADCSWFSIKAMITMRFNIE